MRSFPVNRYPPSSCRIPSGPTASVRGMPPMAMKRASAGSLSETLPPSDAGGDQQRTSPDSRPVRQRAQIPDAVRRDADQVPGEEDLGAEAPGLRRRSRRQLIAAHAVREAKVVLDHRGGSGLTAGGHGLD